MKPYWYLITIRYLETDKVKVFRVFTTLSKVDARFKKNFSDVEAIIIDVKYDPIQD